MLFANPVVGFAVKIMVSLQVDSIQMTFRFALAESGGLSSFWLQSSVVSGIITFGLSGSALQRQSIRFGLVTISSQITSS